MNEEQNINAEKKSGNKIKIMIIAAILFFLAAIILITVLITSNDDEPSTKKTKVETSYESNDESAEDSTEEASNIVKDLEELENNLFIAISNLKYDQNLSATKEREQTIQDIADEIDAKKLEFENTDALSDSTVSDFYEEYSSESEDLIEITLGFAKGLSDLTEIQIQCKTLSASEVEKAEGCISDLEALDYSDYEPVNIQRDEAIAALQSQIDALTDDSVDVAEAEQTIKESQEAFKTSLTDMANTFEEDVNENEAIVKIRELVEMLNK